MLRCFQGGCWGAAFCSAVGQLVHTRHAGISQFGLSPTKTLPNRRRRGRRRRCQSVHPVLPYLRRRRLPLKVPQLFCALCVIASSSFAAKAPARLIDPWPFYCILPSKPSIFANTSTSRAVRQPCLCCIRRIPPKAWFALQTCSQLKMRPLAH